MKTLKQHRRVGSFAATMAERNCAWTPKDMEEEGWRSRSFPAKGQAIAACELLRKSFRSVGSFVVYEWGSWKGTRMLSLRQLHAELLASSFQGDEGDAEGRALIALVGGDLQDAELWSIPDSEPGSILSLRDWRARYGGIDRHLRYVDKVSAAT